MGAVTGKGLADLIRENFGVRVTAIVMILFVVSDLGNTSAEFAGHRICFAGILGVRPVPDEVRPRSGRGDLRLHDGDARQLRDRRKGLLRFLRRVSVVCRQRHRTPPAVGPDPQSDVVPHFKPTQAYLLTAIGVIGTTISPWMQFYIQSAVVEKGVRIKDYPYSRIDVVTGRDLHRRDRILHRRDVRRDDLRPQSARPGRAAISSASIRRATSRARWRRSRGKYASLLFAFGLLNAAIFTASILPLSTAYYVCEAFGFRIRRRKFVERCPRFLWSVRRLDRLWSRSRPARLRRLPKHHHLLLAGSQRRPLAARAGADALARQQPAHHGNAIRTISSST